MVEICKEKFKRYEEVRKSGITNMWAVSTVQEYSGLSKEEVIECMRNYCKYALLYLLQESQDAQELNEHFGVVE